MPGVSVARFDQCQFGLVSKEKHDPLRKRTRLMSNIPEIIVRFDGAFCLQEHEHAHIEGSEGGMKRSAYAAIYPPKFCNALVAAMSAYLERRG